jgi:acyl-CoA synthetase (AMP-forming)/AMP-acid ligase II
VVADGTTPPTADEIRQFCAKHLARYKKPKAVYFVEELPRTKMGKLDKTQLDELYFSTHS